jgi:hypothetical protein
MIYRSKLLSLEGFLMKYNLNYFAGKSWSFALIKGGKIIFRSKADRLKPLIECIKKHKREMRGGAVYDKIVGRAAAILLAHAKVKEVWTPVLSEAGKRHLLEKKVKLDYLEEVESILNREENNICPMEKLSRKISEKEFIRRMLK